jgi:hypothetical protein
MAGIDSYQYKKDFFTTFMVLSLILSICIALISNIIASKSSFVRVGGITRCIPNTSPHLYPTKINHILIKLIAINISQIKMLFCDSSIYF